MKLYLISIIFLILFLIHSFLVIKNKWFKIDTNFYQKIKIKDYKTIILKLITTLASTPYFFILSTLLLILLPNKKISLWLIIGLIINSLIIFIVKHLVKRKRPNIKRLVKEKGYSYISGHTFSATFFYGLIIYLLSNYFLIIAFIILILIIAYSRIYLGVHYLSDIIGGFLLGISYLTIYLYLTPLILNLLHIN